MSFSTNRANRLSFSQLFLFLPLFSSRALSLSLSLTLQFGHKLLCSRHCSRHAVWKTWPQPVSADQPCDADEPSASSVATSQQTGHCTPWNIAVSCSLALSAWRTLCGAPHCEREVIECAVRREERERRKKVAGVSSQFRCDFPVEKKINDGDAALPFFFFFPLKASSLFVYNEYPRSLFCL